MSDSSRSWGEAIDALRSAANELRSALGGLAQQGVEESAAASRLKTDLVRLEQSAANLLSKLATELERQRDQIGTTVDRERAEQTAAQLKASLEELVALTAALAPQVAAAAGKTLKQAEPELKAAVQSIENVAGSAATWIRASVEQARDRGPGGSPSGRPPLDDL